MVSVKTTWTIDEVDALSVNDKIHFVLLSDKLSSLRKKQASMIQKERVVQNEIERTQSILGEFTWKNKTVTLKSQLPDFLQKRYATSLRTYASWKQFEDWLCVVDLGNEKETFYVSERKEIVFSSYPLLLEEEPLVENVTEEKWDALVSKCKNEPLALARYARYLYLSQTKK